jgi:hypothetical protein
VIDAKSRVLLLAAASLLPLAAVPVLGASASEFTDKCAAASQGMFNDQDCNCMDGRAAAPDERQDLLVFFDANIAEQKGGPKPDENSPQIKRGSAALNKLLDQCLK